MKTEHPQNTPATPTRLFLLVISCIAYADKRQACRDTWLANLPPWVDYRFIIGDPAANECSPLFTPHPDEPDAWIVPAVDGYRDLPAKVLAAMQAALAAPGWNWLGKCDDDTYLILPRLLPLLAHPVDMIGKLASGFHWPLGGAGYFWRRQVVESVVHAHACGEHVIPSQGCEDTLLGLAAVKCGYRWGHTDRLVQYHFMPGGLPTPENRIVSTHALSAQQMRALHTNMTP